MVVYEAKFIEDETEGIYALGLVLDPAMQEHWIAFNEHKMELATIDEEKRMVLGAVLVPDRKILRIDPQGNEFFITFSADTIEKLGHDWISKGAVKSFTEEHERQIQGVSVVEAWTVADPHKDKSNAFGKTYEKGTLVAMSKITDDAIWQKIKDGTFTGYSIEALLELESLTLNTISMTKQDFKDLKDAIVDSFKMIMNSDKASEEAEKIEVQSEEVTPVTEAEEVQDLSALKEALGEVLAQFSAEQDKKIETLKTEFSTKLTEAEKATEDLKEENEGLKAELSKTPEAEAVSVSPESEKVVSNVKARGSIKDTVFQNLSNNLWN